MTMPTPKSLPINDYEVILSIKNNVHCLYISELQVVAKGDSLEATYQELTRKKDERIKEFENAGILDKLPLPSSSSTNEAKTRAKETGLFFIKSLIVGFMFIMVIIFGINKINNSLSTVPEKLKIALKKLPRQAVLELEYYLNDVVNIELDPQRRKKIKDNLRAVGKNVKPYIEEFSRELTEGSVEMKTLKSIETP